MITSLFSKIVQVISDYKNEQPIEQEEQQQQQQAQKQNDELEQQIPEEWDDLFLLCYDNEYDVVNEILKDESQRINITDNTKSTVLHITTAKGHIETLRVLLSFYNFNINQQNSKGHNPLLIASCNGNNEIFDLILEYGKHDLKLTSNNMESSLFFAVSNGHINIAKKLIAYANKYYDEKDLGEYIDGFNIHGVSPIHVSVLKNNIELLKLLIESGANVNAFKKDGSTSLHISAISGNLEATKLLLEAGGDIHYTNRYGNTPLHEACIKGQAVIVDFILKHYAESEPTLISLKDKDGSTPLHLACNLSHSNIQANIQVIKVLLQHSVDVNDIDNGGATPLHILACIGDKALEITKLILDNGGNPTIENVHGWTPIHHVSIDSESHSLTNQLLIGWFVKNKPEFLETLDRKKPRNIVIKPTEPADSKTKQERANELFEQIMKSIDEGRIKKIVVLTGAGISVGAGIPTYRSSDKSQNFQAQDGNKMFSFSMKSIQDDPTVYCESLRKHFYPSESGQVKPTKAHNFINDLEKRGALLRVFTQNVDSLHEQTGLHPDYIVHAHGSLRSWRCSNCSESYDSEEVWNTICHGKVPYCKVISCQQIIRPDVVFFGEGLSVEFHRRAISDFRECDCVIVIGTSLTVYPFAGLLNDPPSHIPRILINKEVVGPFRGIDDMVDDEKGESDPNTPIIKSKGKRDLIILSDCNIGCQVISNRLNLNQSNNNNNSNSNNNNNNNNNNK